MRTSLEDDPRIAAMLDKALAPARRLHPPEVVEEMRNVLLAFLATDPTAAALVSKLRERSVPAETTTLATPAAPEIAPAAVASRRRAGGKGGA